MFLRRCTFCLMLFLIISTTTAARKTKRPVVKPAKTFPRTNVAPSIQAQPAIANNNNNAIIPGPNSAPSISSQNDQQNNSLNSNSNSNSNTNSNGNAKQAGYGNDIVTQPGTVSNESEVPKPLNSNDAETAGYAAGSTEKITSTGASASGTGTFEEECDPDQIGFEIITGYVLSAPSKLLDTLPGTLMLTECLEACQINDSCSAVNYETGLCVLFKTTSDQLPGSLSRSQFPVFTIYAQKACLGVRPCSKAWCIDRVQGYRLADHVKTSQSVSTRRDCLELCLGETDFICRSANYYRHSGLCELSDMDRITLAGGNTVEPYDGSDYLENNCAEEPSKLCEFKRISGKILKTVDSVYQDISSIDECRDLCLSSPYKCHSYDYNDTGDMVCRLSHHSRATLTDVLDPYLDVPEAATYERSSCYNVSIECRSGEMVTKIRTSKLFDGKVYAKGAPKSCSINVNSSLEFDFRMGYDDIECNVRQSAYGRYMNDIVIQHHDTIVTSSDLGLAVSCQYDLTNRTVSNDVDLAVTGEIESSLSEEIIIDSPNIVMKITSRDGGDIKRIASVGDPLALRFEIVEPNSPYEIFVRELVAMDGTDNAEITLIDAQGCPTDHFIMGPIQKLAQNRKVLMSHFDAFKFPSSEVVQFRALVTPCIPRCEPVRCDAEDSMDSADLKSLISYGRRRRSIVNGTDGAEVLISTSTGAQREKRDVSHKPADDNILLEQSIQITDKFGFSNSDTESGSAAGADSSEHLFAGVHNNSFTCLNGYGLIVASGLFLLAQLTIITIWKSVQRRTKKERYLYHNEQASTITYGGSNASTLVYGHNARSSNASDTLGKLYDSGINGRYGQQF